MKAIADAMNRIMNAKEAGKTYCEVPCSNILIEALKIMKKNGYVDFEIKDKKIYVKFLKINKCRVISPRFNVKAGKMDKYIKRYLPARNIGIIIISSDKGLMTHIEANEKRKGGVLIAYCY